MNLINNPIARKLILAAAGILLAYAGYSLLNTINASASDNILTSAGRLFSIGLIIYGVLITLGYAYSLISGRSRPSFSRVPFVPSTNDPGISKDDRIKALDDLRQQKLLTDAQYEQKKADILNKKW
ncbi:MAG: SHOCT domain-containing protein [Anaerolineae bacterium]|nr:SHOCT domain-containing protein [Anaerolineae bacterium]